MKTRTFTEIYICGNGNLVILQGDKETPENHSIVDFHPSEMVGLALKILELYHRTDHKEINSQNYMDRLSTK